MDGSGFKQYKVIVISMDDIVFNLNQIRYDFAQLLFPHELENMSYLDFSKTLGTEKSIYSFVENEEKEKRMNDKIETFLYSEKNFKNIIANEYIEDLFKLLEKQGKKVILLTSHSHHLAKILLKKKNLYSYISQVLGLSDFCERYPSLKIFSALSKYYGIEPSELLMITSIPSLLECVNGTVIDKMFIGNPQVTYIDPEIKIEYSMSTIFEALEFGLYGNYTANNFFNPVLGFEKDMDDEEKAERYSFLQDKYKDSPDILTVVEDTYYGNDLLHTTSFDTKEFRLAYEQMQEDKKKKEESKQVEEVVTKKKSKRKIHFFKMFFTDLMITFLMMGILFGLHMTIYTKLVGEYKEIYDGTIMTFPRLAHTLLGGLFESMNLSENLLAYIECSICVFVVYLIIDFIIEIYKSH